MREMRYSDLAPCGFDETLRVTIHRFNMGVYTCRCGESSYEDKRMLSGTPWRKGKPEVDKEAERKRIEGD